MVQLSFQLDINYNKLIVSGNVYRICLDLNDIKIIYITVKQMKEVIK